MKFRQSEKVPKLRTRAFLLALVLIMAGARLARSHSRPAVALMGHVSSEAEGPMEGVLVTAALVGGTVSVTVVSDREGVYTFPASELPAGRYRLGIRAVGYEVDDPGELQITAKPTQLDLKLHGTRDLASQLTSAEWLLSVPGTDQQKGALFRCAACHQLTPVVKSPFTATEWSPILTRMMTWQGPSTISEPVAAPVPLRSDPPNPALADYLSSINLGKSAAWPYKLRSFPRPKGRATKVLIREYTLPRKESLPHDVAVDRQGLVWYNDFHRGYLGRLNPATGEAKEWRVPVLKPGFPECLLALELDREGNAWLPRFYQGCSITKFDRATEKFVTWTAPARYNGNRAQCAHIAVGAPEGTVWFSDSVNFKMFKLNPRSGRVDAYDLFPGYSNDTFVNIYNYGTTGRSAGHRTYGIAVDSKGNGYFCDIAGGNIGRVDAQSGKVILYAIPTPNSGPRRDYVDSQDRLWFGEYYAGKLGMFDTTTKQFKEWSPPTPWNGLYPVVVDRNGEAWSGGMSTDYVYRLDPKTGEWTEYLLPTWAGEIRHIGVDNSTTPVSVWIPEVHAGKIARIQALD
jgi:virginiamycin B lyase